MVKTGLDKLSLKIPDYLKNRSVGVLCHAPSINSQFDHIVDLLARSRIVELNAIFGPQHGLYGQTQDNMIEWEGSTDPIYNVPLYSLYGDNRKPTKKMLEGIDTFIVDLQDIGTRPYTYIWSLKLVMEACKEANIHVVVLDRPNPVSNLGIEGPVLKRDYFTFVGGAEIPLLHNMTIGEIAVWLNTYEEIDCKLTIEWMTGWERGMSYYATGLPWVAPSPNMPSLETAKVYPGMVLTEALNLSEARGTTLPFELFGAPSLKSNILLDNLKSRSLKGCIFRVHDFIPTFNKFKDEYCRGIQIHITDTDVFEPVYTAINLYDAIIETMPGYLTFNDPPYEYEYNLVPFDILTGDSEIRETLVNRESLIEERERWRSETADFRMKFDKICHYQPKAK